MRGYAREWAVRAIAENLLNEARLKFEKERQPEVVRNAASFFKDITDGRYEKGVFSRSGGSEIRVTDFTGNAKRPSELSRGTREQLFLSLRFGLIRDLGRRSERLPVIVDEALVNFDPHRGLRAASAFVDLAQTNQVLVFTLPPADSGLVRERSLRARCARARGDPDRVSRQARLLSSKFGCGKRFELCSWSPPRFCWATLSPIIPTRATRRQETRHDRRRNCPSRSPPRRSTGIGRSPPAIRRGSRFLRSRSRRMRPAGKSTFTASSCGFSTTRARLTTVSSAPPQRSL